MINEELESWVLSTPVPLDIDNELSIVDAVKKKVKANPKRLIPIIGGVVVLLLIIIIGYSAISSMNKHSNPQGTGQLTQDNTYISTENNPFSGIDTLKEQQDGQMASQSPAVSEQEGTLGDMKDTLQQGDATQIDNAQQPTESTGDVPISAEISENEETQEEISVTQGAYYLNPTMEKVTVYDSCIQLNDTVFKLPVYVNQFEEKGINLVLLGVQPPDAGVTLSPAYRNGYIQAGNERYLVYLKNSLDCTYSDLLVYGIKAEGEANFFYTAGGLSVGSEEASLPTNPTTMEETGLDKRMFYKYGSVEKADLMGDAWTGKMAQFVCKGGKVESITIIDDGTGSK